MQSDLIADTLTRIRNAQRAGHKSVAVRNSKAVKRVLEVLRAEGFIQGFDFKKDEAENKFGKFDVQLKYFNMGEPAMSLLRRVSKSGRRVYSGVDDLPKIFNGLGISIVSTSQGVMSDREARKKKIGGEVIAYIG